MSNKPRNDLKIRTYANKEELSEKTDALMKEFTKRVEETLGPEKEGVSFMPVINIICKMKDDPTTEVDPVSFSVVKRPPTTQIMDGIVHNIFLKDQAFITSIMQGLAASLSEIIFMQKGMEDLFSMMEAETHEEAQVEHEEIESKPTTKKGVKVVQGNFKKNSDPEVN